MPKKDQDQSTSKPISQQSAKTPPTGRTKEKTQERPVSPAKPAAGPVTAKFKAGKDV